MLKGRQLFKTARALCSQLTEERVEDEALVGNSRKAGLLKSLFAKVCVGKIPWRLFSNKQMPVCISMHIYIII